MSLFHHLAPLQLRYHIPQTRLEPHQVARLCSQFVESFSDWYSYRHNMK